MKRTSMWRSAIRASCALLAISLSVATAASASPSHRAGGTITVGVLYAFTGANAQNGTVGNAGCQTGVAVVNKAGGVLGNTLQCATADTKSDLADAVPAANQLLAASTPAFVIGPSDEAPATVPVVTGNKVPEFATVGDPKFDTNTDSYFYRITPSDALQGRAIGYWAPHHGYTHGAAVFTNDLGAQTSVGPLRDTYKKEGGKLVANLSLAPGHTSYRTEVVKLLASHPDAIFTEMDPATSATFLSEMVQLGGGKLPPIITTQRGAQIDWLAAVSKALGSSRFTTSVTFIAPYVKFAGSGYASYKSTLLTLGSKVHDPKQYLVHPYAIADYDAIMIASLAMTEAKSTKGSDFNKLITQVTAPKAGATIVHSYAEGVRALKAGKKIQYIGTSGSLVFNRYHSAPSAFAQFRYDPKTKQPVVVKLIPGSKIA